MPISLGALVLLSLANEGVPTSRFPGDPIYDLEPEDQQPDLSTSRMLSALFGYRATTPRPTEAALAMPHQMPPMYYNDFYEDLLATKRNDVHSAGCDCKVTNQLRDLGSQHFPRYLMTAVCESRTEQDVAKCTHGANCRPLEYKLKVLKGTPAPEASPLNAWMGKDTAQVWEFRTVTVTAGCFCAK
ncbi:hypothetical protein KR018_000816 [Drosophila ironensis]|nr:hypothetical protein KR018_000816 [Drosophila ironensis]